MTVSMHATFAVSRWGNHEERAMSERCAGVHPCDALEPSKADHDLTEAARVLVDVRALNHVAAAGTASRVSRSVLI